MSRPAVTLHDSTGRQAVRFLMVGAANTVGSYAVFLILANWIFEPVAYSIGFVCGLVFTTYASSNWVFRSDANRNRRMVFVAWYLLIWLVGLIVVQLIGRGDTRQHLLATSVSLAITVPLNFFGGRRILGRRTTSAAEESGV